MIIGQAFIPENASGKERVNSQLRLISVYWAVGEDESGRKAAPLSPAANILSQNHTSSLKSLFFSFNFGLVFYGYVS